LQHYHRALAILEQGPESAELARAISALSQMHMLASEYDQAIAGGERAQAMAERLAVEDVIVHALNNIGSSVFVMSDPESGLALLQESLRRALDLNLPHDACRAYTNMGEGLIWQCRYEEARTTFEDLHAYASRIHAPLFSHVALTRLTELDWLAGRWAGALPRFQKLIEIYDGLKSRKDLNRVWISILLGWIHNDLGQPRVAQQVLESELPGAQVANEIQLTVPHLGQLARAYAAQSIEAEAEATIGDMLDMIERVTYCHPYSTAYLLFACQWLTARKSASASETARACLRRLEQANRQIRTLETEAALSEGQGSLALAEGKHQQAAERFRAALAGWEALARPYDQLRTLSALGRSLTRLGEAGQAQAAFDQAWDISQTLADQLDDKELKSSFLDSTLLRRIRRD